MSAVEAGVWADITSLTARSCSSTVRATVVCTDVPARPGIPLHPQPAVTRSCGGCDTAWAEADGILCWSCGGLGQRGSVNITSQYSPGGPTRSECELIAADVAARGI